MRLFVDARKLQHGGIGRYLENLLQGLFGEPYLELSIVCASAIDAQFLEDLNQKRSKINFVIDTSSQYSFQEYFVFPLKYKKQIGDSDWYISPHYTLPFFISCKKVVVIHDCIHVTYPDSLLHKIIGRLLISSAIKRADKVLTVSESSKNSLREEFGNIQKKINVIPNSIFPLFASNISDHKKELKVKIRLLFVGADRAHKRLRIFIDFLSLLKNSNVNFEAVVVSQINEESKGYIENHKLSADTKLYSQISNQELFNLYKDSDFLVCTSAEEGFCLPILEAMSLGISVIAPKKSFSEELLSEVGWYFEPGSASDLFRVFAIAIRDRELRQSKIILGLDRAKNYTLEKNALQFMKLLKAA